MDTVSIIIPAYNEEKRIEKFLRETVGYAKRNKFIKEIIVVDDGSYDDTPNILRKYDADIKILRHHTNNGKGAAVRTGVLASSGDDIIFMDADGSTSSNQIPKLMEALKKYPVVIGSRIDKNSKIVVKQPLIRIILGKSFNLMTNILFPSLGIYDTLCGFKGMRKKEGRKIFNKMVSDRWVFDVEMLIRAKRMGHEIAAVPIIWKHEGNAKMRLGINNMKMFLELLKLRLTI